MKWFDSKIISWFFAISLESGEIKYFYFGLKDELKALDERSYITVTLQDDDNDGNDGDADLYVFERNRARKWKYT
jgi:hypothetical protein